MSPQGKRFCLGLLVLGGLGLLGGLLILFGSFPDVFRQVRRYTVTFADAPGVAAGIPVRRSGIRIGEVEDVELDVGTGQVKVRIGVETRYPLLKGDQVVLVHGLLGGDTTIDLVPRAGPRRPGDLQLVAKDAVLEGRAQADVSTVLSQASGLVPPAQDTLKDLSGTLHRLDRITVLMEDTLREYRDLARATRAMVPEWQGVGKAAREMIPEWRGVAKATQAMFPEFQALAHDTRKMLPDVRQALQQVQLTASNWGLLGERLYVFVRTNEGQLGKTLEGFNQTLTRVVQVLSDDNQQNLAATLKNVRTGSAQLANLTYHTGELIKESQQTVRQVSASVQRADAVLVDVERTVKPLPDRIGNIFRNLDESTDKLNKFLGDVREFWKCTATSDGSYKRFLCDPSLYNHLDDAACSLNRAVPRLDRILRDLQVFSDKIARHPEALGLGGVVRPSAGLKEAPSSMYHGP